MAGWKSMHQKIKKTTNASVIGRHRGRPHGGRMGSYEKTLAVYILSCGQYGYFTKPMSILGRLSFMDTTTNGP
jgi:hypothetical protein